MGFGIFFNHGKCQQWLLPPMSLCFTPTPVSPYKASIDTLRSNVKLRKCSARNNGPRDISLEVWRCPIQTRWTSKSNNVYAVYMCILYLHFGQITDCSHGFILGSGTSPKQWFVFTSYPMFELLESCLEPTCLGGFISRANWAGESLQNGLIAPVLHEWLLWLTPSLCFQKWINY